MEMLPIFLKLEGRKCLVVGAGTIAAPKIISLVRAGGQVTVVSPRAEAEIVALADCGVILWHCREFDLTDLDQIFLVITGTNVKVVNHSVAEAARARGILCNSVDDPPDCDFYYPSVVKRGDLQIAISTAGKSPALAQRLRAELETLLPEDTGAWLDQLGKTRQDILEAYPPGEGRKQALHLLAQRQTCQPADCPVQRSLGTPVPRQIEINPR
jgi:siroheme synthase-like protein